MPTSAPASSDRLDELATRRNASGRRSAARGTALAQPDRSADRRRSEKHGGNLERVELKDTVQIGGGNDIDLILLDTAMNRLAELDPEQAKVVELRFFGGLGIEETGVVLGVSPATIKRQWIVARAWLARELKL